MKSLSDLKSILDQFKNDYTAGLEIVSCIEQVIKLYEGYLQSPTTFFSESDAKAFFLKEFTEEVVKVLKISTKLITTEVLFLSILVYKRCEEAFEFIIGFCFERASDGELRAFPLFCAVI